MKNLTELAEYQRLTAHFDEISNQHMRNWFAEDRDRFSKFSLQNGEMLLDYSRNRINDSTIKLLCDLANAVGLPEKMQALSSGKPVNFTENRAALHTALRDKNRTPTIINDENIASQIMKAQQKMADFTAKIHDKTWRGVTGKPIKHIINIGIGGSHLGPQMCSQALKDYAISDLEFHFVSSIDQAHVRDVLKAIDPETSLFIVSSKSFSTLETMTNTKIIHAWMKEKLGQEVITKHFVAVTAAADKARAMGIPDAHIFPLWEWVGGRYSIWSAIGLPLMLMIGEAQFEEFLMGAHAMDQHFLTADFSQNMPVLMALLSIWYINFFNATAHAIVPYSHRLRQFIPYIQQAEMESNGKRINSCGEVITHATGPIIFGEEGCNGQHAYHQLLHQGQHLIPVDFILIGKQFGSSLDPNQDILVANGLSQAQALMRGKTYEETLNDLMAANYAQMEATQLAHHQVTPGNRPSNVLFLERITPNALGKLIALYEHKIFVQGAIWDINSFDQWGVELGKQLLPEILRHVQGSQNSEHTDSATHGLIHHFNAMKNKV